MKRSKVKNKSELRKIQDENYKTLKSFHSPKECAYCGKYGGGWLSEGGSLHFHHINGRYGWFFYVGIPLCATCHDRAHQDPQWGRESGLMLSIKKGA